MHLTCTSLRRVQWYWRCGDARRKHEMIHHIIIREYSRQDIHTKNEPVVHRHHLELLRTFIWPLVCATTEVYSDRDGDSADPLGDLGLVSHRQVLRLVGRRCDDR